METDQIDIFENDIDMHLKMFCEEQGIEDLKKEPQSVWNAALIYIKRHVFAGSRVLKASGPLAGYINNNNNNNSYNLNNSNCNRYNIDIVNNVCDYYIYLCLMHDKEVSLIGFSNLTGINTDTLIDWGNGINKLSTAACDVYKKLCKYREESLSNKLVTGNKNPLGVIAVLNRQFGWASPYTSDSNRQRAPLTASELPRFEDNRDNLAITDKSELS